MRLIAIIGLIAALSAGWSMFGWWLRGFCDRFPNPPTTKRQIKRAARANRPDLSTVRHATPHLPELLVPMPLDHFDHGGTEP